MDGSPMTPVGAKVTMESVTKNTQDVTSFSNANLDAVMNAGQIWIAGCQAITKTMAASAQAQLDQARSNWNALTSVKSLQEMLSLPVNISHKSFETAFAETGKLADASIKLTKETMAPITARVMLAVEKFQHPTT